MKLNIKNFRTTVLALSLTLLSDQSIRAEEDFSQVEEFFHEDGTRGLNPQLTNLLSRLSNLIVSRINGNNPSQTLSSLASNIATLQTTLAADIANSTNGSSTLGANIAALTVDVNNLNNANSALFRALLAINIANGVATPLSLISSSTTAQLQTAQVGLIQITQANAGLGAVTPNTGALATYNTSRATALTNLGLAITAVQLNITTPTAPNLAAAIAAVTLAVTSLNTAIANFNLAVNANVTITAGPSYAAINTQLNLLLPQLLYLQSLGL